MTLKEIYKTILAGITQVRNVASKRLDPPYAPDALLDEMARNAAQALVLLLDEARGDEK